MATIVGIDYETYYDDHCNLKALGTAGYLLDKRFSIHGAALMKLGGEPRWFDWQQLRKVLHGMSKKEKAGEESFVMVSHKAQFDMGATAWHGMWTPKLMACTLSMSRAMVGHRTRSCSLKALGPLLDIGVKDDDLPFSKGKRQADMERDGTWSKLTDHACNDVRMCMAAFAKLMAMGFPKDELRAVDSVIRMFVEPSFKLDGAIVAEAEAAAAATRFASITAAGLSIDPTTGDCPELDRDDAFAALLAGMGVSPPTKITDAGKTILAFSLKDQGFTDLLSHADARVRQVVQARIDHKAAALGGKGRRMADAAELTFPWGDKGKLPVELKYGSTMTHRLTSDGGLNLHNMERGSRLRDALRLVSPATFRVVKGDMSQIDARVTAWMAGCEPLLQAFREGRDVYREFAAELFGVAVAAITKEQRYVGKQCILGLGFGERWASFAEHIRFKSLAEIGTEIVLSEAEARRIIATYERRYPEIAKLWALMGYCMSAMADERMERPVVPGYDVGHRCMTGPSGLALHYHDLRQTSSGPEFTFAGERRRLWRGMLTGHAVQHVSRCLIVAAAERVRKRQPWQRLALQVHDDLSYVIHVDGVKTFTDILREEMCRVPEWAEGLPLACEIGVGPSYGEAG